MAEPHAANSRTTRKITKRAVAGAGGAMAAQLSLARTAHAAGSDVITMALIGCGGRGTGAAMNVLANAAGAKVKLVAMADPFRYRLEGSLRAIQERFADQVDVPPERQFLDLEGYLKGIQADADLVLLCSPPGFRPMHFEAAVRAGKHVFMEKPLAVDAPGVRRIMAANAEAKRKGLAVAVGHHLRHEVKHREVIQHIHDGAIGEVRYMRAYFNSSGVWVRRRADFAKSLGREPTEMEYQVNNWYYFTWLSGDHIVEQHVHDLDVMNWIKKDTHPVSANGMGGRQVRVGPDYGEIFDHHSVEFEYADGTKMYSFCRHIPGCWESFSEHAHGPKGFVSIQGHGRAELHVHGQPVKVWERGPDGHQLEMDHLMAALLAGTPYNEVDATILGTMTAILGRMATYSGQQVTWEQAIHSELDLSPSAYTWDGIPQPKPGPDGLYPCAVPGATKAW